VPNVLITAKALSTADTPTTADAKPKIVPRYTNARQQRLKEAQLSNLERLDDLGAAVSAFLEHI
jgi:hypothetical protein